MEYWSRGVLGQCDQRIRLRSVDSESENPNRTAKGKLAIWGSRTENDCHGLDLDLLRHLVFNRQEISKIQML